MATNCIGVRTGNRATFIEPFVETIVWRLIVWAFVRLIIKPSYYISAAY